MDMYHKMTNSKEEKKCLHVNSTELSREEIFLQSSATVHKKQQP